MKKHTVFNTKNVNFIKQPMFFGEPLNTQRYDQMKYPIFNKIDDIMEGFFWRPQEIQLDKDVVDYQKMSTAQQHIFTSNLKYQTIVDSIQGRGPALALLPHCSLPELESAIITWNFFEKIHSKSYQHILRGVYGSPTPVLDCMLDDKEIIARASSITQYYDLFLNAMDEKVSEYKLKTAFYKLLIAIAILEGVQFYASFACTFAFGENKIMEGPAKILKLIARDEAQHFAITKNIVSNYRDTEGDNVMLKVIADTQQEVVDMFGVAVETERRWGQYLFKDGSILGLNDILLNQNVEYDTNKRMKSLGYAPIFTSAPKQRPLPWMEHWLSSKHVQTANQETENTAYLIGAITQDSNIEKQFKGYEL